jgi:hypothetical protein
MSDLETLARHRDVLRLVAVGALLHCSHLLIRSNAAS